MNYLENQKHEFVNWKAQETEEKKQEAPDAETKDKPRDNPEIIIKSEKGINLMSFMLKGYDPKWGDNNHELSKATNKYFRNNPLGGEIRKTLDNLNVLNKDGINQEILFNIALSYQNPKRLKETSANLIRDEEIENPDELQMKLLESMEYLNEELNTKN
ncbi:MAG: hypothetical protein V1732_04215 [Patescibacteria group bacterium]